MMTLDRAVADSFGLALSLWAIYTGWRTLRTLRRPPVGPWLGFALIKAIRGEEAARRGEEEYYTPNGESLSKGFLRSPLEFSRVTSSFSNSRLHPVYGFHRAHTGTDFGAPTGTRVKAVGDAVVSFAGRKGGYGNLVILRHQNGYETYYAHLNGFAKGIRPGAKVEQGEVIGYVGMTGTATGPHLHFEVRRDGKPEDPAAYLPK